MSLLLDTNVVSALRRPDKLPPPVARWFEGVAAREQFISVITLMEIEIGLRRIERTDPARAAILRRWKTEWVQPAFAGRTLPIDAEIAERCALLHVPDPRPTPDSLIAATALVKGLTLVTRDVRDFGTMIAAVLNPWATRPT